MTPMLARLLANLNSAFDRDPKKVLALRLSHPDTLHWNVDQRVLTLSTADHTLIAQFNLTDVTIDDIANGAVDNGCTVVYQNADLTARSGDILLDGNGLEGTSNGDHLYAYTSLLWAVLDSYAIGLETAERDGLDAGLRQAYLDEAEGAWLDLWGSFLGVARFPSESDSDYLQRTILEVLRPRNNAWAISKAVFDELGLHVDIYEPWQDIFTLDVSTLSGAHHFQDGNFYTWTVIQPILRDFVPLAVRDRVLRIINRNRAAGVLVVRPFPPPPDALEFPWPPTVHVGRSLRRGIVADHRSGVLDESLVLSDTYPERLVEFEFRFHGTVGFGGGQASSGMFGAARTWATLEWDDQIWTHGVFPDFQWTAT